MARTSAARPVIFCAKCGGSVYEERCPHQSRGGRTVDGTTSYTSADLKATAIWALHDYRCPADNKRVKLQDYELRIPKNGNTHLLITGICKGHGYTVTTNCAI